MDVVCTVDTAHRGFKRHSPEWQLKERNAQTGPLALKESRVAAAGEGTGGVSQDLRGRLENRVGVIDMLVTFRY